MAAITALVLLLTVAGPASGGTAEISVVAVAAQTRAGEVLVEAEAPATPAFIGTYALYSYDRMLGCCVAPGSLLDNVDDLAATGQRAGKGELTRAGQKLEQHQGGLFPSVSGNAAAKNALGQEVLEDILTTPGSRVVDVTSGNFAGGFRVIAPDGRGATFDADGLFQYFGEYP